MARAYHSLPSRFGRTLRGLSLAGAALLLSLTTFSQSPSPSPSDGPLGGYTISGNTEVGARWVGVNGDEDKFRSDINQRSGFKFFDSSVRFDNNDAGSRFVDSGLIMASGWGSDPSGSVRANIEKKGTFRLDTNIRRVALFNDLRNHAIGDTRINYHNYNIKRNFGDLDLTIFPESQKFRLRLGGSYNLQSDPFTYTSRASNAFPVEATSRAKAFDYRIGADTQLLGFNISGTYGFREFIDRTSYRLLGPNEGDVVDTRVILEMERKNPIDGRTHFGILSVQRTFAERFDVTAKIVQSQTSIESRLDEYVLYRVAAVQTRDIYSINGDASRPQTRADLGMTWRITDAFRLSNTFTFDSFHIDGSIYLAQNLVISTNPTLSFFYYVTKYRRFQNTFEGDYQFSDRFALNAGYRVTNRDVFLSTYFRNVRTNVLEAGGEDVSNTTNSFIGGAKIKPLKNWSIYADTEIGKADNVFTRAGNADFTNYRIRSLMRFDKFAASVSYISRDNEIPTDTSRAVPRITDTQSRTFSATLDWSPMDELTLSGGYNRFNLTSRATINFIPTFVDGLSEYYVRDNYFFVDAAFKPNRRFAFFGTYRWNKDTGHGDRTVPALAAPLLIGSYPFDLKMPEVRASVRINRHLDWNVGYQYYDYREEPIQNIQWGIPFQNYNAHLPYTSLRIYFGKGSDDR